MNDESSEHTSSVQLLQSSEIAQEIIAAPCDSAPPPRLGALDIVEAFTSLRHELKLQVRSGRELQQSLAESLQRLEQRISVQQTAPIVTGPPDDSRKLAEAIAEIEESLQRAIEMIGQQPPLTSLQAGLMAHIDEALANASWLAKSFSGKLIAELRTAIAESVNEFSSPSETLNSAHHGLNLMLARVHRLMQHTSLERIEVLRRPFDAEIMRAIDMVEAPGVPSAHVAEQLRPVYLWRGQLLRYADVRLAK